MLASPARTQLHALALSADGTTLAAGYCAARSPSSL